MLHIALTHPALVPLRLQQEVKPKKAIPAAVCGSERVCYWSKYAPLARRYVHRRRLRVQIRDCSDLIKLPIPVCVG